MDEKKEELDVIKLSVVLAIAISIFNLSDMFFKFVTWDFYNTPLFSMKLAMLLSAILFTTVLAFTKKTWRAALVSYIIVFIMTIINELKVLFAGEPLYFSDINFLNKVGDLGGLIAGNVSFKFVLQFSAVAGIFMIILGLLTWVSYKFNMEIKNKKARVWIIIINIILLLLLFVPSRYTKDFYWKIFYNIDEFVDFDSHTTNLGFYLKYGFINGMYGMHLNNIFVEPTGYDEGKLLAALEKNEEATKKFGKPNIIVVFSESFWDIDKLDEIKFDKEVTGNFNKLKEKGKLVNVISPSYGGMSENVTFELVTGASMNYFSRSYIPIMSFYTSDRSVMMPSLVRDLKENGYETDITFSKDYYNSKKAYTRIGFDSYQELIKNEDYKNSDTYCTDILIDRLENKGDNPIFYVIATIEGHMPYAKDKYEKYDINITKSDLSEESNDTLLSYAQGLYNSDKELLRLYNYIESMDEPTILVFMGDHLPFMHTENRKNVINELEYFNTDNELENNYRLYNPQALILSNYDEEIDIPDYIGVDNLLSNIVNQLDVEVDDYYKWLYSKQDILPGINSVISFDKDGKLYYPEEITEEMKDVFETRRQMQYMLFVKNK